MKHRASEPYVRKTTKMKLHASSLAAVAAVLSLSLPAAADPADEAAAREAAGRFASAFAAGDLSSVLSALPSSWRANANEAAKALGAKAGENPAVWTAARGCLSEISAALAKKSGFAADLLSRSGVSTAKAAVADDGSAPALVRLAAKLGAVTKAATPDALASGGLSSILAAPALTLPGVTDALPAPAALPAFGSRANADGSITVGIPGGKPGTAVKMVKREGAWVPAPLADLFAGSASWKDSVSSLALDANSGSAVTSALGMIRKSAASAAGATTQEQFDKAVTNASFPLLLLGSAFSAGEAANALPSAADAANLLKGFLNQ